MATRDCSTSAPCAAPPIVARSPPSLATGEPCAHLSACTRVPTNVCAPQSDKALTTTLMCGFQSVSTVRSLTGSHTYGQINAVGEQLASGVQLDGAGSDARSTSFENVECIDTVRIAAVDPLCCLALLVSTPLSRLCLARSSPLWYGVCCLACP